MPPKIVKEKKKAWTTIHQEKYIWLYNHMTSNYDNIEKDSYIDMNKRELMGIIEKNEKWGDSSKEGLLFMIARYLFNKKNNDRYVKIYQTKGFEYIQKNKKKKKIMH